MSPLPPPPMEELVATRHAPEQGILRISGFVHAILGTWILAFIMLEH